MEFKPIVIGSGVGDLAGEFASKGAAKTYVVDDAAAENYNVDVWSKAIKAAAEASGADLILISNTPTGCSGGSCTATSRMAVSTDDVDDVECCCSRGGPAKATPFIRSSEP